MNNFLINGHEVKREGNKFTIILPSGTSKDRAKQIVEGLEMYLQHEGFCNVEDQEIKVKLRSYPWEGEDFDSGVREPV